MHGCYSYLHYHYSLFTPWHNGQTIHELYFVGQMYTPCLSGKSSYNMPND